jgi:chromosome partitioning protein
MLKKNKEVPVGQEKNIYAFCNQKGGVGKTTTVINFGTCLAQLGFKVIIIDMDPQGNATSGLGIDKNQVETTIYDGLINTVPFESLLIKEALPNIDILPANSQLAGAEIELISFERREFYLQQLLRPYAEKYDFVLIDCPPSLGLLTINALVAADRLMIPLQCEYYALEGLGQLIDTYNLIKERLNNELELFGVVMTMADFRTNLTDQVISEVREYFKEIVFSTIIPRSVKLSEAPGFGKPAVIYAPNSRGVYQYQLLAEEFLDKLNIPYNYYSEDDTSVSDSPPIQNPECEQSMEAEDLHAAQQKQEEER